MTVRFLHVAVCVVFALAATSCADASTDAVTTHDGATTSSKADWGEIPDVDWANQFFLTQIHDERWNPDGVVDDRDSNNCGPASLAMLMAERGVLPAELSAERAIDHARALMYPGYPDIDTFLLPDDARLSEDGELVFVDDDTHPVYFDRLEDGPSIPQGIEQSGATAVFGYSWEELDRLLTEHGGVIAYGHITTTWRERFSGDYGVTGEDAIPHFVALFPSTSVGSVIVCDPMHTEGAVVMTQGDLQAFFKSPINVFDTSLRLVAWDSPEPEVVDPYAMALDVTAHRVTFPEDLVVDYYDSPYTGTGYNLVGTEFWQKWSGGKNPTYQFSEGTDYGKRCMLASAKRFAAMMAEPPEAIRALKADSNWSGSFFNWNDDYSESEWGDGQSARLWAWKTGLIKWISQTNQDGSCYLPTLEMVEKLSVNCLEKAAASEGEIVGCTGS